MHILKTKIKKCMNLCLGYFWNFGVYSISKMYPRLVGKENFRTSL